MDPGLAPIEQEGQGGRCRQEEVLLVFLSYKSYLYVYRSRKVAKVQRAIVGASLEEIRVRRAANKPKVVAASSAQK